jgi:ABC-type multidrug transport system ATPase subunit
LYRPCVPQDDLLYEALTVYETLYYAAMLRLPRRMSQEDKLRRIDVMVQALGLRQCRDTIVGERRPGQRKVSAAEGSCATSSWWHGRPGMNNAGAS